MYLTAHLRGVGGERIESELSPLRRYAAKVGTMQVVRIFASPRLSLPPRDSRTHEQPRLANCAGTRSVGLAEESSTTRTAYTS